MARKRSLFDWLTGSAGQENDYSFDDLESGSSVVIPTRAGDKRASAPAPMQSLPEEPIDGELSVDVYQTPTHIVVKAMIAGVRPEDLDVTITRDMVTVRGKREQHTEGTAGDFFFQELYWGSFLARLCSPKK
jgi:HSP20 family molecular chaperone IbpA